MENNITMINTAINKVDEILPLVKQAERHFSSARNWGVIDILGGGFLTDVIKHIKINSAGNVMSEINWRLHDLQNILGNISMPVDYSMNVGGFATFADFVFDGVLSDLWMESKIMTSINQVRQLESRLIELKSRLSNLR